MGHIVKGVITIISLITAAIILGALVFGKLPTLALSTDIEAVEIKIAANEAFMLDEAIDTLQQRIWANVDRQQTYRDKKAPIPANLREQLKGYENDMEELKRRREKLQ